MRAGVALVLVLASEASVGAAAAEIADYDPGVSRCRLAFESVADNPAAPGGWLLDLVAGETVLCLYGSVADAVELEPALGGGMVDRLVLRSTGGPVPVWLGIGELLAGRVRQVIVDEACFSSCANYAFPLGTTVRAKVGSLVVWHGGPTLVGLDEWARQVSELSELIHYYELAVRTEALYARLGIDTYILRDSERAPVSAQPQPIDGYAIPPEVLDRCYGFDNTALLWHAGDDAAVHALGRQRSADLDLLATPGRECPANASPPLLPRDPG